MKKITVNLVLSALLTLLAACGAAGTIPQVGDKAPDFTLKDINGNTLRLSQFQGKTVLLVFASINCKGCEEQMPHLITVAQQEKENLVILEVYQFNGINLVRDYVTRKGYTHFPALADPKGEVATKYGAARNPPTNFVIDKSGTIKYRKIGPFENSEEISSIIRSL